MGETHRVFQDYPDSGDWRRFTCETCGITCRRQRWMSQPVWEERCAAFHAAHPCERIEGRGEDCSHCARLREACARARAVLNDCLHGEGRAAEIQAVVELLREVLDR